MTSDDRTFFQFEADFVESLRCIPMAVRYKLDTCGVKLKLEHWHQLALPEREQLVSQACQTEGEIAAYRKLVRSLVWQHTEALPKDLPIDPAPPWLKADQISDDVQQQSAELNVAIAPASWAALSPLQRFALCKLSRPGHENRNFLPALQEFGLP
ncbi:MAG: nitrate reductase associated protein [Leptolyngbyaceae cyanobacterium]